MQTSPEKSEKDTIYLKNDKSKADERKKYINSPVQLMLKDDLGYNVYPLSCINLRY